MALESTDRATSDHSPKKRVVRSSKRRPKAKRSTTTAEHSDTATPATAEFSREAEPKPAADTTEPTAASKGQSSTSHPPKRKAARPRKKKITSRAKPPATTAAETATTAETASAAPTAGRAAIKKKRPQRRKSTRKPASATSEIATAPIVEIPESRPAIESPRSKPAVFDEPRPAAEPFGARIIEERPQIVQVEPVDREPRAVPEPQVPQTPAPLLEPAARLTEQTGPAAPIVPGQAGQPFGNNRHGRRRSGRRSKRRGRRTSPERQGFEAPAGRAPQTPPVDLVAAEVRELEAKDTNEAIVTEKPPAEPPQLEPRREGRPSRRRSRGAGRSAQAPAPKPVPTDELEVDEAEDQPAGPTGAREMMINCTGTDERRIAVLHEGRLEELYIERQSSTSHVNSIYKGRVTNVEPSIQAVFVDFGQAKNGFLHISDVHPQYFPGDKQVTEIVGKKLPHRERPPIQRCFRRGQEVIVQVSKEGVGTKGPTLTTYLSIPGRFLVMMPGMTKMGVSRKIEDESDRVTMREILTEMSLPEGMGFILRTAGKGRAKRELQRDLNYLTRLWKTISDRIRTTPAPCEVYQESDLVIRTIRDVLSSDFKRIVVDDEATAETAREFLRIALPRTQDIVEVHRDPEPLFHKYGIEQEIESIHARLVPLPLGGSIVIEQTEAMVTIDVNSGRYREIDDAEESAYRINMQAAEEIARQLRLRDLGGLIVCDFIDMRYEKHKRGVERCLRDALKKHKERARILRMSQFGLIEMTRQRQGPSIKRSMFKECAHCRGSGLVKTGESMVLEVMRVIQLAAHKPGVHSIAVSVSPDVATLVQNNQRARICQVEERAGCKVTIRGEMGFGVDQVRCECFDGMNRLIEG